MSEAPPASFQFVTHTFAVEALHLLHYEAEDEHIAERLTAARHVIDLLAVLQEKTKGNLTMEEQRDLDNSVTELRFRYIQAFEEHQRSRAAKAANPGAESESQPA